MKFRITLNDLKKKNGIYHDGFHVERGNEAELDVVVIG